MTNRTTNALPSAPTNEQLLSALRRARVRLEEVDQRAHEPIAIIGMACRFPGHADSPEAFWQLLCEGNDAITEVPSSRWDAEATYDPTPGTANKASTKWGGFIDAVDRFDAAFFGISPREAAYIDPQQRLMLELSWQALERAAIAPASLSGSRTGVFIGASSNDYARLLLAHGEGTDAYSGTGNAFSILANRLSYSLDLRGPSLSVDTACSSSLVAAHQACQSLRHGECDLALVGGVNLMLTPDLTIAFSQARMMAADGRCKTFDANADGYVRSEGAGMVLLKRLSDAQRDGDVILAVVKGSAINQDGRSNGLTAPNGPAQQVVIQAALHNAQLKPAQIGYVETHGTGTALGDPIEVNALRAVLMEGRVDQDKQAKQENHVCWLGAVKANIGHLEAAAGIAGLIKAVLCLQHGAIPKQLHVRQINPHIDLAQSSLRIPTQTEAWLSGAQPRYAGVSSFGFGGTNAHVILGEAPAQPHATEAQPIERPAHVFALSAKSEAALNELVQSHAAHLAAHPELALADVCYSANTGRNHFAYRTAVVARNTAGLQRQLQDMQIADDAPAMSGPVVFLFTGQGAQYARMGHDLYKTQPVFRAAMDQCAEILRPLLAKPLLNVLVDDTLLNQTEYTQPALFALAYALVKLWQSWGVQPAAVVGHSVGEYVAACVAGAFSLEDGLRAIALRGRLMQSLPSDGPMTGAMAAVFASEADTRALIAPFAEQVDIAAVNGRAHTVISGAKPIIAKIIKILDGQDIESRPLKVSHAFHSPLMQPILDAFEREMAQIPMQPLQLPLASNVSGDLLPVGHVLNAAYWRHHVRHAVRFVDGIDALLAQGYRTFVEIGPKPVLTGLGRRHTHDLADNTLWLPSLNGSQDDWSVLLSTLAALYAEGGATMDWAAFDQGYSRQRVLLPTYRFQRERHWLPEPTQQPMHTHTQLIKATIPVMQGCELGERGMYTNGNGNGTHTHAVGAKSVAAQVGNRTETVLAQLRTALAKLLRTKPEALPVATPFTELGVDSIILVDAARQIESTYTVKVPIRRFFEDLNTLQTLANYIAQQAPADLPTAPSPSPVAPTPVAPSINELAFPQLPASPTLDHGLSQQLLAIINKQLDLLNRYHLSIPTSLTHTQDIAHPTSSPPHLLTASSPQPPPSSPSPRQTAPLTEAQQQLWFLAQMGDDGAAAYSLSFTLHMRGALHLPALRSAVQMLIQRHEALRTVIGIDGDVQHILPNLNIDVPIVDLSTDPAQAQALDTWLNAESARPFDMTHGPLFRVTVLVLNRDEHILVMSAHHIIIDGLSTGVLIDELAALYNAACVNVAAALPEPTQYGDYAEWQIAQRDTPNMQAHEAYWLNQFPAEIPVLELPLDRARPPVKTYNGAVETIQLDKALTQSLHTLSRQHHSTLFMTLLSAYMALLHRLSGQEDVIVGVPSAGRGMRGSERAVGYFAHLLPIRHVLSGDPSFADLLNNVRATLLNAYEHQDYPFARLIGKLNVTRDLSLSPVVSTTFNLTRQNELPPMQNLRCAIGPRPASYVDHELSLNVIENNDTLTIDFEYNRDIFDAETVRRIAGHFQTLLAAISADCGAASSHSATATLQALPLLTERERQRLLVEWNATDFDFNRKIGFHQLFEAQVIKTPTAIAVRYQDEQLTYAELNQRANGLAHQLKRIGVDVDGLVALLTDRSPDFMAAMLALFKAGGAYLPLDVRAPASRYAQILEQSRVSLLLITDSYADVAAEALAMIPAAQRPRVLKIEDLKAAITLTGNLPTSPNEDIGQRLAYVIYTSGSTGTPKGAMVEQRGMINHLYAKIKDLGLTDADTVAQTAPQSFDISVWQFLSQLMLGGCVHILPDEIAGDPLQLLRHTAQHQITILEVVPSLLRMMLEEIDQRANTDPIDLSQLRWMIPTGEALPPNLARRWLQHYPNIPMLNAYGPTECSDDVTHYAVTEPPNAHIVNMSIGRPVVNMRMYILDATMQPVPIGVAGELYVGGIGVGRGYIHDAERTAAAFVRDPFSSAADARLYKTGDKARYLPDGNIEYLGRLDYQVKIRGFRIELGEIEAVLERHPAVKQSVVVDRADRSGNKKLVAYAVLEKPSNPEEAISGADLRRFMNDKLPDYMVPSAFVLLDEMPLTPNGKVNRKALPAPDDVLGMTQVEVVPPRTDTERTLVDIWAEVLSVPKTRVGITSDFFELGGHSLLATQAASRIRQIFQIDLPLRTYFNEPTIADLAEYVDATRWATGSSHPSIKHDGPEEIEGVL